MKAIMFDLDDTLLRDDRTISDYTVQVLREAASRGIHVIPASGRAKHSMEGFVKQLGCASMFVSCNGAEVWTPEGEPMHQTLMSPEIARETAVFVQERGCYAQVYGGEYFYYNMEGAWARSYAEATLLKGVYVGDLTRWITAPTAKLLVMDEPERVARFLLEGRARFAGRLSVSCSKPYFLEFNPIEATKGNALRFCADRLGITPGDVVAFGDSLNDMSMLETAGLGVAMGNARQDVKERCAAVCLTNQEDGVARYVQRLLEEAKV